MFAHGVELEAMRAAYGLCAMAQREAMRLIATQLVRPRPWSGILGTAVPSRLFGGLGTLAKIGMRIR
jgi:hypothetical protein